MTRSRKESRPLDRAAVLVGALAVVDAEGLEVLTMRRLADSLGVNPMTLYRFAASKDDLLDGLVGLMYEGVDVDPDAEDWEGELLRFAHEWRTTLLKHPQVIPLVATRPLVVPLARRPRAALDLIEKVLKLLSRAGMDHDLAVSCYKAIVSWLIGEPLTQARTIQDDPDETERAIRLGLQHLPAGDYRRIREVAETLATDAGTEAFDFGLRALLSAYRQQVRR